MFRFLFVQVFVAAFILAALAESRADIQFIGGTFNAMNQTQMSNLVGYAESHTLDTYTIFEKISETKYPVTKNGSNDLPIANASADANGYYTISDIGISNFKLDFILFYGNFTNVELLVGGNVVGGGDNKIWWAMDGSESRGIFYNTEGEFLLGSDINSISLRFHPDGFDESDTNRNNGLDNNYWAGNITFVGSGVETESATPFLTANFNTDGFTVFANPPAATPEPTTMLIIGLGLAGLGLVRRSRKK